MLTEFGTILIFFILGAIFVAGGLVTNWLLRPNRPTRQKQMVYECGEETEGSPHPKFNIRFYVIALAFLLFDLEFVLLFPWATALREAGEIALLLGLVVIGILLVGDIYLWKKGDLDWALPKPGPLSLQAVLTHDRPRFRPASDPPRDSSGDMLPGGAPAAGAPAGSAAR